jgi:hypothetical protein
VLLGQVAHGHHGIAEREWELGDHQQDERRAERRGRRQPERGQSEGRTGQLRPGHQPRPHDAGGHHPEREAVPPSSGGQGDHHERRRRQGHGPGGGRRPSEHGRGLQHEADRGDRQEHTHAELEGPDHRLREEAGQDVGDPVDREEQEEQADLQARRVDHRRGQPLRHGHGGESLEGLDGERDPEGQAGGHHQEAGDQHDRARVEAVHQDERRRQGDQDAQVGHGPGGIARAGAQPEALGYLRAGGHGD